MTRARTNAEFYTAKLTELFEMVEPQFRADTISTYKAQAEGQLVAWLKTLEGPEPKGPMAYLQTSRPNFVRLKPPEPGVYRPYYEGRWEGKQEAAKLGLYEADLEKAEREANASVDGAKTHFIYKQSQKLSNATKLHEGRPKLSGALRCNGVVTGHLDVKYKGGDGFRLMMSIIVNYRHVRGFKSFHQFPARFTDISYGDVVLKTASERYMSENFQ